MSLLRASLRLIQQPRAQTWCRALSMRRPMESDRTRATEALVTQGAALITRDGSAAFAKMRQHGSEWYDGETYLFSYDLECNVVFNAASPEKEGSNTHGHPDMNGKLFHNALVDVAGTPKECGWVDYAWPKPGETDPSQKWTFSKAVSIDGTPAVLMSGFYTD